MNRPTTEEQLEALIRGCEHIYTTEELRQRLDLARRENRPLRVKLGMDPTAPDIHLGHSVVLRKLRQFQDFGHKAVLIIGDYTAMIGDPSGRSRTRPMLSPDEIERNARTYLEQAGRILDLSPDRLEVRRNSEWLARMTFADVLRLASRFTVARMLERDTFARRYQAGVEIYIHEFLYPLMQGQDSVAVRADVELGGTDQTFNNLVGRDLQRDAGQPPQIVMILPLLVGLDGREKMSKTLGNYVGITEPPSDMFAKIMSIPDELMPMYFELLTSRPPDEVRRLTDPAQTHPRDAKEVLAADIVACYHGSDAARAAADEFRRVHGSGQKGLPDHIPDLPVPEEWTRDGVPAFRLVAHAGFADTNAQAKRLIAEGGFRLNGQPITDPYQTLTPRPGDIIQRGRRRFARITT